MRLTPPTTMAGCRKRLFATALLMAICFRSLPAQGTDALPFTRIGLDPEVSGMAGAGASFVETGAYTAFSGASALPFTLGKADAAVSYRLWAPGAGKTNIVSAAASFKPFQRLGLALGYSYQAGQELASGDIPVSQIVAAGIGFGINSELSVGVNARYSMQKLTADYGYKGFSGDVFLNWRPIPAFGLSMGAANIGSTIRGKDSEVYSQPALARLAIDWTRAWGSAHETRLLMDAEAYFSGNTAITAGVQYAWNKMVYARAGYRFASENCVIPRHLALGLGVHWHGLRLDLSWFTASKALGNTLAIGLGYSF